MPRLSLWREKHTDDYKFIDKRIYELFTAGGTGFNINKYLGPNEQTATGDVTLPTYTNQSEKNIQDLLFLENRDRKYDRNVYSLRGHYTIQDTDFNLSQFGLFVTNDTLFVTFHINDMIERMGRRIIPGDVLEFLHLRDTNPLDPDDQIPIALKKYYVVQETTRASEGFSPTWWPHLWRCKVQPMVDGQEYRDILEQPAVDADGNDIVNPVKDYLSTYAKNVNINDRIIEQAEKDVPLSGYDTNTLFTLSTDANGNPLINYSINADTNRITADTTMFTADYAYVSPDKTIEGYVVGDGNAPNGLPIRALTYFPDNAIEGDYVLRMDYLPHRMFRFNGKHWIAIQDQMRAALGSGSDQTQFGSFVNNSKVTVLNDGTVVPQKVALSKLLKIKAD